MEALGFVRFRLVGHDRGGRVGYRLALDHPGRVERLAMLDIVPTYDMWRRMNGGHGHESVALDFPRATGTASGNADRGAIRIFLEFAAAGGAKAKKLSRSSIPRAMAHYRASFPIRCASTPYARIIAPGVAPILPNDEADRAASNKIACRCWRCGARAARSNGTTSRWHLARMGDERDGQRVDRPLPHRGKSACDSHRLCWTFSARSA